MLRIHLTAFTEEDESETKVDGEVYIVKDINGIVWTAVYDKDMDSFYDDMKAHKIESDIVYWIPVNQLPYGK